MNRQRALLTLFLVALPALLLAQIEDEDPFRRDPFFTKPIHAFFPDFDDHSTDDDQNSTDRGNRNRSFRDDHYRRQFRQINQLGLDLSGSFSAGPYNSSPLYSQYPNMPMVHFNRANGLFMGIEQERMQWHNHNNFLDIETIRPHGFIGYGTASGRWEYAVGLEKLIGINDYLMVGGEYHKATSTEDYWRVGLIETSMTAFLTSYDYLDYHLMEGFGFYLNFRTPRLVEASLSYNVDEFSSLELSTRFSIFGRGRKYQPVRPIDPLTDNTDIKRFNIGVSFNPKQLFLSRVFSVSSTVTAELAGNSRFDNEFNYNKYLADVTLFYNLEPGSILKWRVKAGSLTGEAPQFKEFHLGGIGSLRAAPYKSISGNRMLLSNFELQFGPANRYSDWIDFDDFHITLFLDSGWASYSTSSANPVRSPFTGFDEFNWNALVHSAGVGLGSGLIRGEVAWPLNSSSRSPQFWIRLNPTF